jgi:hypothetical protein
VERKIDILIKEVIEMKGELKEMKKYNDDVLNVPENFITVSMLWIFNFIIIYLYSNYFNQIF